VACATPTPLTCNANNANPTTASATTSSTNSTDLGPHHGARTHPASHRQLPALARN